MALQLEGCLLGLVSVVSFAVVSANPNCLMGLQEKAAKCFSNVGIDINDPQYSMANSGNGMIFNSVMSKRPDSFCMKKEQSKEAIKCLMNHAIKCLPSDYREFMPQGEAMGNAMDVLCEHRKEIDLTCVQNNYMALFQCGQDEAKRIIKERGQPGIQELFCLAFKLNPVCQKRVLKGCGCKTVKVYTDISYDFLYPKSCPELNPHRVVCSRVDSQMFINDGLGDGCGFASIWIWNLLITVCLAITTSWFY